MSGQAPNSVPSPWAGRILILLFALAAVLLAWDFFADRYVEHPLERWKAVYPIFGFGGISLLIVVAKGLRRVAMRPEDHYGDD